MGILTIVMIALSAVALVFGMLYGMGRGRNRSILRLILILGCIAGAIFLREPVVEFLMEIEVAKGETVAEMLYGSIAGELPQGFSNFAVLLIGMIINLAIYFILFFLLRIVSWLILFPILKIFVKTEIDKRKGAGAIIGLIQGIVIIFAIVIPLNGLAIQVDKLSQIKMEMPNESEQTQQTQPVSLEIPPELGLSEYANSGLCGIYNSVGDWYFDMITTVEFEDSNVNLGDMCDVAVGLVDFMDATSEVADAFNAIKSTSGSKEEIASTIREKGLNILSTASKVDKMSKGNKELLSDLIKAVFTEAVDINVSLKTTNLATLASAFDGIAMYYEDEEINQEQATNIIQGVVDNWVMIENMIDSTMVLDTSGQSELFLKNALDEMQLTDQTQINKITTLFGLSA